MSSFQGDYARNAHRRIRAGWKPAQPGENPGALVPGEGDTVDPPWLIGAIEAAKVAANAADHRRVDGHVSDWEIEAAIRAALPLITRGALEEAADDLDAEAGGGSKDTAPEWGLRVAADMVRERAARQVTG